MSLDAAGLVVRFFLSVMESIPAQQRLEAEVGGEPEAVSLTRKRKMAE